MKDPLISVIIPTYNRESSTRIAVESVLNQSYRHLELIVVDDGSTDETCAMLQSIEDSRFRCYSINNSGVSHARNYGVERSTGEMICFLDSDDEWYPHKLSRQWCYHKEHPSLQISQTKEIWVRNGRRVNPKHKHKKPHGYIFPQSLELCTITPSSVMMNREMFLSFGGFDEKMPACEDYDLWLRITAGHQVGLVDEFLMIRYGGHRDQLSAKYVAMDRFRIYSLAKNFLSGNLNKSQALQVREVLERKLKILISGAEKRGHRIDDLAAYPERLDKAEQDDEAFQEWSASLLLQDVFDATSRQPSFPGQSPG